MPKVYNRRDPNIPADAVYVGRPTKWGNPFTHLDGAQHGTVRVSNRAEAIARFREWVWLPAQEALRAAARVELRGKDLVCWCAPADCHAVVWIEIANAD